MLVGHEAQIAEFCAAMGGRRLHHAWLVVGPEGVGKAEFALKAAARLLAESSGIAVTPDGLDIPDTHPTARLVEAGSHPDLVILQRLEKEKTGELARSISIAQVRKLLGQFNLAPSQGNRRVVIIDAAEDMERAGSNALLKALEEPPANTLFFLISHAPDKLLPTIRSRCRTLRFSKLDNAAMDRVLRRLLPEISDGERANLIALGDGIPGKALTYAGLDVGAIDKALSKLSSEGDPDNSLRHELAVQLSGKTAAARYDIFLERAPLHISMLAKSRRGAALAQALETWGQARALAEKAVQSSMDSYMTVYALATSVAALAPATQGAKA